VIMKTFTNTACPIVDNNRTFNEFAIDRLKLTESTSKNIVPNLTKDYIIENLIKANIKLKEANRSRDENLQQLMEEKEAELQETVNRIREEFLGIKTTPIFSQKNNLPKVNILLFGDCKLNRKEIFRLFNSACLEKFGVSLPKKSLHTCALDYNETKNFGVSKSFKSNRYDLIIIGPHPHSIKNKNVKEDFRKLKEQYNLKAKVSEKCDKPLSKEFLSAKAEQFFDDLLKKNLY